MRRVSPAKQNSSTAVVCIRSGTDDRHCCWSYYRCSHHHRCHRRRHYSAQEETVWILLSL